MRKKIEELENNSLLSVSNWWGLREAGTSGIILTKDRMLYNYTFYYMLTPFLEQNNIPQEYISKGIKITDTEYEMVIKFIEEEIVDKKFECWSVFDAGWTVLCDYKDKTYHIRDVIRNQDKNNIYDKTEELLKSLKGER